MNPRVSCDCDFFRVGGEGDFKNWRKKKNVYTCTVCRCPLRVSTLAVVFLHFCSGPASILTGDVTWRNTPGLYIMKETGRSDRNVDLKNKPAAPVWGC